MVKGQRAASGACSVCGSLALAVCTVCDARLCDVVCARIHAIDKHVAPAAVPKPRRRPVLS